MAELIFCQADFEDALRALAGIPRGVETAMLRAVNRTAQIVRTDATRIIRDVSTLRAEDVRSRIFLRRARWKNDEASAEIVPARGKIPLLRYNVRPAAPFAGRGRSLTARVLRSGSGSAIPRAFVARLESGHMLVFRRAGKARFPIKELYGPALGFFFRRDEVDDRVFDRVEEVMEKRIRHEIDWLLKKGGV